MLRQSSSRSNRSKKLRPKHSLQVFLLVAVSLWLMYQLAHSYSKRRRAVAVENAAAAAMDGEVTWRRLGRKGVVDFASDDASNDDGVRGNTGDRSIVGIEADAARSFMSDQSSKGTHGGVDGDEDEEDTGEDDPNGDDDDDGLPGDEDDDGFHQAYELDGSVALLVNSSDGADVPLLKYAADGTDKTAGFNTSLSVRKNSSVVASLSQADVNLLIT
ncbi:hypothetical protein ABZP36_020004 [Zizania latifolia]